MHAGEDITLDDAVADPTEQTGCSGEAVLEQDQIGWAQDSTVVWKACNQNLHDANDKDMPIAV
jgi:hypothetical protein